MLSTAYVQMTLVTIGTQKGQKSLSSWGTWRKSQHLVCVMGYNLTATSTHAPIQGTTSFLNIDGCYGFHGYNPTICVIFNKIESEVHS